MVIKILQFSSVTDVSILHFDDYKTFHNHKKKMLIII